MMVEVDTFNKTGVSMHGGNIAVLLLPPNKQLTKEEALVHAAWIVTLADDGKGRWQEVLDAVQAT